MRVVPLAIEPNMTARWEMDLSPGTVISPVSGRPAGRISLLLSLIDDVPVFLQKPGRLL